MEIFLFNTGPRSSVFLGSCHMGHVETILRASKGIVGSLIEKANEIDVRNEQLPNILTYPLSNKT